MTQTRRRQRLANKRDVVGSTAAAAGLRDDDGQLIGVVTSAHHGFHNLTRHQNGRIADVVVHIFQAGIHRTVVDTGQQLEVIPVLTEYLHQQIEMNRRHLRTQNGVARLFHFFGELHLLKLGRRRLALLD